MTANVFLILLAIWVQGALALVLLAVLGGLRLPLIQAGKVRVEEIALSVEPWPAETKRVGNSFNNQFQLPVLFVLAGAMALYLTPTTLEVVLCWLFVLSRLVHAGIHATRNLVVPRFWAFAAGYGVLVVFWGDLLIRLLAAAMRGSA